MKLPEPKYTVEADAKHRYTIRHQDGLVGPLQSVTSITGILDKPALVAWAAREASDFFKAEILRHGAKALNIEILEAIAIEAKNAHRRKATDAADLGTACHAIFEAILKSEEPETIPDELKEPSKDFKRWRLGKGADIEIVAMELAVASLEHRFGGRLDALGYSEQRGGWGIVDYKTSSGFYGNEYAYQAGGGYRIAIEEQYGIKVGWAEIIRFGKKAPFDSEGRPVTDLETSGKAFLALLAAANTLKLPLIGEPTFSTATERAAEAAAKGVANGKVTKTPPPPARKKAEARF